MGSKPSKAEELINAIMSLGGGFCPEAITEVLRDENQEVNLYTRHLAADIIEALGDRVFELDQSNGESK